MDEDKKEVEHFVSVLSDATKALIKDDSVKLKELSNKTIHSASIFQDTDSITIAILIYSLSKLVERREHLKIKNWSNFTRKFNLAVSIAARSLEQNRRDKFTHYLEMARKSISSISPNIKPAVQDVLRKASINKASKIYEHGISMEQTAKLLGITQWELSEYTGQTGIADVDYNKTMDVKARARMALEFFS